MAKSSMKLAKETFLKKVAQDIANALPEKQKNAFLGAQCKGASSWLAALPLKSIGFALSKRDFTDGICSRYGWKIRDMPSLCGCGKDNSYDYALSARWLHIDETQRPERYGGSHHERGLSRC